MSYLLSLARQQRGKTFPNPVTAAAVVQNGEIVSTGVHGYYGGPHAEAEALKQAGERARGATLYVTLEPCTHFGKTPPCVNTIMTAGISKVIYAVDDPNPTVRQKPARHILEQAGITVVSGVLEEEAILLNDIFFKNQLFSLPFVTMKVACSLDGKIALSTGESKYITSDAARKRVHRLRREADGILVGIGTVLHDDPLLDVRFNLMEPGYFHPAKIVLDPSGKTPPDARLFQSGGRVMVIVNSDNEDAPQVEALRKKAEIIALPQDELKHDWHKILEALYRKGLCHVLIEGGARVFSSALKAGVADALMMVYAPKIFGGTRALAAFPDYEAASIAAAPALKRVHVEAAGEDAMISGYFYDPCERIKERR